MDENGLVVGRVYDASVRGIKGAIKSLYIGKRKYCSFSLPRYVVASRDKGGEPTTRTFTRFVLKGERLTMKYVRDLDLSDSERQYLDDRLKLVGL